MIPTETRSIQKKFIFSLVLTSLILLAEVIGGLISGSLALLSDAAHVFMDIFALALSFVALRLSIRPPDDQHSFGWHRLEVVAALINGASLFVISIGIWVEAVKRFQEPQEIQSTEMLIIAVIGLVVNLVVAFVLGGHQHEHGEDHGHEHAHEPKKRNLNVQSAFLHVLGDAISSVGVIAAAILIGLTGLNWIDPLISILIGVIILVSAIRVTRSALHILLEGVPEGLSVNQIKERLNSIVAIKAVHDLHVWNLGSDQISLSAHVILQKPNAGQEPVVLESIRKLLDEEFHIRHTTIQFEAAPCLDGHGGCN